MKQGFTLLELSIVLVIIGLIAGGVTVGSSMIRAAELRSIITEQQQFHAAIMTFKDKYFSLPGDMTNASNFWGAADGSTGRTAGCYNNTATGIVTCNGDGNSMIDSGGSRYEEHIFWEHLANAELIEGSFTGTRYNGSGYENIIDGNLPGSKLTPGVWYIGTIALRFNGGLNMQYANANVMVVGGLSTLNPPNDNLLTPKEAWNIDKKIDDGKPGTGSIRVPNYHTCIDASSVTDFAAPYELNLDTYRCSLMFYDVF